MALKKAMNEQLPVIVRDYLLSGYCISANVVTLSCNYLSIPDIPISDYVAAVEVQPLPDKTYRIIYREIPEYLLKYEFEWDRYATVNEESIVKTVEEVEQTLARYVTDFSRIIVGSNIYTSA